MRTRLAAWREHVGAQMPSPNPGYDPAAAWTTVFAAKNDVVRLEASLAEVNGTMLRYEPPPHKNTLGYWTRAEDWVRWDFAIKQTGRYEIELLQGCGKGSGGAEVLVSVGGQAFTHVVEDTGHFQNFVPRVVGVVNLEKAGRHTLTVKPRTKPGVAVMDLRAVTLRPVKG